MPAPRFPFGSLGRTVWIGPDPRIRIAEAGLAQKRGCPRLVASATATATTVTAGIAVAGGAIAGGVASASSRGALNGAFSAAIFFGIGQHFAGVASENLASGVATGASGLTGGQAAGKILAHGIAGGVKSELGGGKFGNGFFSAGLTQALAPGIDNIGGQDPASTAGRILVAGLVGGTASEISGGKFANGAITAMFSRAFNDESHIWEYSVGVIAGFLNDQAFGILAQALPIETAAGAGFDAGTRASQTFDYINPKGWAKKGTARLSRKMLSRPEKVLDTNVVISHGKHYVAAGENVVQSSISPLEIKSLVARGKIKPPAAAGSIPVVGLPSIDTRINVRGGLTPGRSGNFGDGIIGATAIERGSILVTSDKELMNAVIRAGGSAIRQ